MRDIVAKSGRSAAFIWGSTALVTVMQAGWAAPAFAQAPASEQGDALSAAGADAPRASAAAAEAAGPADNSGDIVVTANKRAENIQRVPISVVAVTPQVLTETGVLSTAQLQQTVPGLSFQSSGETKLNSFYVRGVGTYALSAALESSVGVTVDGVPLARVGGSISDLVDIERVEVLKGPQGMLFGKNATAGLVGVVTRKPEVGVNEGEFNLSYGTYNELNIDGAANIALGDNAALRITAWRFGHDGIVRDLTKDKRYNDKNSYGVRVGIAVEPTSALRLTLIGQFDGRDENGSVLTYRQMNARPPFGAIVDPYEQARGIVPGPRNRVADPGNEQYGFGRNFYVTGLADLELGGGYVLSSLTSYRNVFGKGQFDPFASSNPQIFFPVLSDNEKYEQVTQELRIASPADRPLSFVAGLFFYDFDIEDIQVQGFVGVPVPGTSRYTRRNTVRSSLRNIAAFGELTYRITPEFRLIAGLRQSQDHMSGYFNRERVGTDAGVVPPSVPIMQFTPKSRNYSATSYRFGAQFDVARDVMLYATASRGYKAPGFNLTQSLTPVTAAINDSRVEAEIAKSYEIGLKSQFFDRRLTVNIIGFHSIFSNFQTTVRIEGAGVPIFAIQNANELKSSGVEFEVTARPVEGLSFGVNGAYINARYTDFKNAACYTGEPTLPVGSPPQPGFCVGGVQSLDGFPLSQSPKWSYNASARYETDLGTDWKGFVSGNYSYRSSVVYESVRDPGEVQGGYGFFNMTVGVGPSDDRWSVAVYARNLFDRNFVGRVRQNFGSYTQGLSYEGTQRFGVQVSAKF